MRLLTYTLVALSLTMAMPAGAGEAARSATLYKSPQCTCCEAYADYLRDNGFKVAVKPTHGVPEPLDGCHTMLVDDYVVEGHVPLKSLNRLLTERPEIKGISLPGMPMGSPGMSGTKTEPFTIYEISGGAPKVYAIE
jgi:hypothetical protein